MRKSFVAVAIFAALFVTSSAQAGSIDYLTNQSADYIRTFCRNAATDGADIVTFNPAGTAWLDDGLYVSLSNQFVLKDFNIELHNFPNGDSPPTTRTKTYSSTKPTLALPSLYVIYKWQDLAAFFSFTVPAGGGSLQYDDGVPFLYPLGALVEGGGFALVDNGYFEGSSMYLAPTVGAAYRFFDIFSISASLRTLIVSKSYKGSGDYGAIHASLEADKSALGFGGIFGLQVTPIEGLNIAARYEMETALALKTTSTLTNIKIPTAEAPSALESFVDGAEEGRDLPAMLGAGISYSLYGITAMLNFNYYFIKDADSAKDYTVPNKAFVRSYDDDYDNGYDIAAALEYAIIPDVLVASVGYNRGVTGSNKNTLSDFEYALNSTSIGLGARYMVYDDLDVTLALANTMYEDTEGVQLSALGNLLCGFGEPCFGDGTETFKKNVYDIAIGVQYKFF